MIQKSYIHVSNLCSKFKREEDSDSSYERFHSVLSLLSYLMKAPLVPRGTPVVNALNAQRQVSDLLYINHLMHLKFVKHIHTKKESEKPGGRKKKKRRKKRDNENELELEIIKKSNEIYENTQIQRERCLQIYSLLRQNIQNSILSSYHNSGFFWEHYDDVSGKGTRGHPFSGWTSLIINIMAEI